MKNRLALTIGILTLALFSPRAQTLRNRKTPKASSFFHSRTHQLDPWGCFHAAWRFRRLDGCGSEPADHEQ